MSAGVQIEARCRNDRRLHHRAGPRRQMQRPRQRPLQNTTAPRPLSNASRWSSSGTVRSRSSRALRWVFDGAGGRRAPWL